MMHSAQSIFPYRNGLALKLLNAATQPKIKALLLNPTTHPADNTGPTQIWFSTHARGLPVMRRKMLEFTTTVEFQNFSRQCAILRQKEESTTKPAAHESPFKDNQFDNETALHQEKPCCPQQRRLT